MIDCDLFINRFYPTATDKQKDDVKRFLKNLNTLIDTIPLRDALLDKQILCSSFYLQQAANGISQSHYLKIKSYLINLFTFVEMFEYNLIPSRAEVIKSQETSSFFPSLSILLQFIDDVGKEILITCNPQTDLARIKSICVLGWLGLSIKEIAGLKNTDIKIVHDSQSPVFNEYEIKVDTKIYRASGDAFAPLYFLQSIDSYNGLPTGRRVILKGDEDYLFRAIHDTDYHDGNAIRKTIQKFNDLIPLSKQKSIVFRSLNKNRIFLELYKYEQSNMHTTTKIPTNKIMNLFGCGRVMAYHILEQYKIFSTMLKCNKL